MIEKVILGFGSNTGNRLSKILSAIKRLSLNRNFDLIDVSSIYETEPWGYSKQNRFLNCCGVFLCRLDAGSLVSFLQKTEKALGRVERGRWNAREIDIDVLFYGKKIINKTRVKIPHPLIRERNFVMIPLLELVPGYVHPELGIAIESLIASSEDKCSVRMFKRRD